MKKTLFILTLLVMAKFSFAAEVTSSFSAGWIEKEETVEGHSVVSFWGPAGGDIESITVGMAPEREPYFNISMNKTAREQLNAIFKAEGGASENIITDGIFSKSSKDFYIWSSRSDLSFLAVLKACEDIEILPASIREKALNNVIKTLMIPTVSD